MNSLKYIKIKRKLNELLIKYNSSTSKKNKSMYYKQIIELDKQLEEMKNE